MYFSERPCICTLVISSLLQFIMTVWWRCGIFSSFYWSRKKTFQAFLLIINLVNLVQMSFVVIVVINYMLDHNGVSFLFYILDRPDSWCLIRSRNCLPRFFGGVLVPHLFSFLCSSMTCLYVLSCVLWCPLRFLRTKRCSIYAIISSNYSIYFNMYLLFYSIGNKH
jgi:hypothetical protein